MKCPKCNSEENVKDGFVKDRQRYKCKSCDYRYTIELNSGMPSFYKRLALLLFIEGMGFRKIGRTLGVSNVAVLNWIKAFGINSDNSSGKGSIIKKLELEEMHIYLDSNKIKKGCGSLLINWDEAGYSLYLAHKRPVSLKKK